MCLQSNIVISIKLRKHHSHYYGLVVVAVVYVGMV